MKFHRIWLDVFFMKPGVGRFRLFIHFIPICNFWSSFILSDGNISVGGPFKALDNTFDKHCTY